MFLPVSYVARVPKDRRAPLSFAKEVFSIAFFHERGLSLPVTVFLPWLLLHYVLKLHHLTSGQVHHFAVFVTLCKAFLRLPPISRCGVLSGLELHPAPTCTPPMHRESWEWGPDQSEKRKMEGVLTQFDALIVEGPHR
jgi:hypothetical protein